MTTNTQTGSPILRRTLKTKPALILIIFAVSNPANAATITNTNGDLSAGSVLTAAATGDLTYYFDNLGSSATINLSEPLNFTSGLTISWRFSGSTTSLTIGGGDITANLNLYLYLDNPSNSLTINSDIILPSNRLLYNNKGTVTFNGDISSVSTLLTSGTTILGTTSSVGLIEMINDSTVRFATSATYTSDIKIEDTATLDTGTNNVTITGVVSNNGTNALVKTGSGTLTLTGNNTYTGTTTISDGTLQIGDGGTSGTLGTGNTVNNSALTFNRSNDSTYAGNISGTGNVTKDGAGTLTLSGTNSYSGITSINDGTISIGANNNLGASTLTLDGGTLQTTGSFASTRVTTLNAGGGTFNTDDGTTLTQNGKVSGSGTLTKTGVGTLVLNATNNNYTGGTVVSQGTLRANFFAINGLGNVTNNATLELNVGASSGSYYYDSISGTGNLVKSGEGSVNLFANSTYTGATTVNSGTLVTRSLFALGDNGAVSVNDGTLNVFTSGLTIGSLAGTGGTVTLNSGLLLTTGDDNTSTTYSGAINGSGRLSKEGTGTFTLAGSNTYSGITTINAGALQIGNGGTSGTLGTGNVTNSGSLIFNRSDDSSYAGVISGTGSVRQNGSGNFNLTGTNTYSGTTTVNAGILSVNGSIVNSTTTVNSGGTLGGTGTVGNVSINGGTFAPGNSIGTLNVAGNVDFTGGGNYDVEVDAAGNNDKIVATGTATLTSGTVNVQAAAGTYDYATDYTILTAAGGLGGTTFGSVNSNLAFLTPTLSYDTTSVFLNLARNDTNFSAVANTPNQTAVSTALENNTSALSDIVGNITPLTSTGARQAYDSLSGVQHTNNQLVTRTVSGQFNQLLLNHGSQSASGSLAFNAQPLNSQYSYLLADNSNGLPSGYTSGSSSKVLKPRGWWAQGFGSFGEIDDTDNARGADYKTGGLALGIDGDWNDLVIGIAGSYAQSDVDPYSGSSSIDSYQAATYGSWQPNAFYVNAAFGLGLHKVDTSRQITMGSTSSTASSYYDSFDINGTVEAGQDFALNLDTTLTPFAGISYLHNTRDGFNESGAGAANLNVDEESYESLLTSIGVRVSHGFKMRDNRMITPVASIAYVREHLDRVSQLDANFNAVPTATFIVDGPELDRDRLQLALGVTGQLTGSTSLNVGYTGEIADSHDNHIFSATVDFRF